jgi:hypothetical protein
MEIASRLLGQIQTPRRICLQPSAAGAMMSRRG